MLFSFSLKSSILLIFFFHGIVFSILLFIKGVKTGNKPSFWLSLFTFLCSCHIVPFMLGYAGWYSRQPYRNILFYIPFQQLFLLPPVLYFYFKTLLDRSFKFSKRDYVHFIPALIYLIYSIIVFLTDMVILKEDYFYKDGRDKDFSTWYQIGGLVALGFYLFKSLRIYRRYKMLAYDVVSFADSVMFKWAKNFLIAFLMLVCIRVMLFVINPEWAEFGKKFWYYLSFSLLFYLISINGYTNSILSSIYFTDFPIDSENNQKKVAGNNEFKFPFGTFENDVLNRDKYEVTDIETLQGKIEMLMLVDKIYENPDLVISDLNIKLNTHSKKISQVINQEFYMNFNDFVNHYRIKAFLQKVKGGEHNIQTFLSLAFECGFNSKSTFNRAFKKATSLNPKDYIKKHYGK